MSRKPVAGLVCAAILLLEVIIFISLPKTEKWDLEGKTGKQIPLETLISDRSLSKTREKVYQLEHEQTNYNNNLYILFTITAIVGVVVVSAIPNKRQD